MSEETTLLSPDNHEIRLKLIAIETPMVGMLPLLSIPFIPSGILSGITGEL